MNFTCSVKPKNFLPHTIELIQYNFDHSMWKWKKNIGIENLITNRLERIFRTPREDSSGFIMPTRYIKSRPTHLSPLL